MICRVKVSALYFESQKIDYSVGGILGHARPSGLRQTLRIRIVHLLEKQHGDDEWDLITAMEGFCAFVGILGSEP